MATPPRPPRRPGGSGGAGGPRRSGGASPSGGARRGGPRAAGGGSGAGGAPSRGARGAGPTGRGGSSRAGGPPSGGQRRTGASGAGSSRRDGDAAPGAARRAGPATPGGRPRRDAAAPGSGGRGRGPAADSSTTKRWGGVARRGARNLDEPRPGTAAAAWRDAAAKADREREQRRGPRPSDDVDTWVDAGPVRDEASAAVARGGAEPAPAPRRKRTKELPSDVADEVAKVAGPAWAGRVKERLGDAARAYEAERYRDAKRILEGLLERAPSAVPVRELLGLTLYRMGKWRDAIRELGAVELLTGSVDHHPVIADCHRALHHMDEVERLWDELRRTGAGVDVVIEGRIVTAGAFADAGRMAEAIAMLEAGPVDVRRPHEHHLRLWYALAAMYERAGDVPRARSLFGRLVSVAPEFGDAAERLDALGG